MRKFILLITAVLLLLTVGAFGATSAAELNNDCDALKAKDAYSIDRNSNLGTCLGYMNAVMDSFEGSSEIVVIKDFIVGDMITSFQRYAPQHHAEPARKAIVNAMISDGYLKQKPPDPCGIR